MRILTDANYRLLALATGMRWRCHALIIARRGVGAAIVTKGMPLGIDFSGGTQLIVKFEQPVTEEQVRDAVTPLPGDEVVQQYDDPAEHQMLIRLQQAGASEAGAQARADARSRWSRRCRRRACRSSTIVSRDLVGPTVGAGPAAARDLRDDLLARGASRSTSRSDSASRSRVGAIAATPPRRAHDAGAS